MMTPYRILHFRDELQAILDGKIKDPIMVEFFLTEYCNHNCSGCLFRDYRGSLYLPTDACLKILKDLSGRVKSIEFCGGGEPTLHPDFEKIIREGKKLGFKQGIITNGSMLNRFYKTITETVSYVRIGLDSCNKETHNKIHGSYDFENIVNGIKLLVEERNKTNSKLEIGLKMLLVEENKHELLPMVGFAKELGVDNVQIKVGRETGKDIVVDEFLKNEFNNLKNKYDGFVVGSLEKSCLETPWCLANLLSCFINTDGECLICCYYQGREKEHSFGNILKDNFWDIWYSQEHLEKVKNIDVGKCNVYDCRFHNYNRILKDLKERGIWFI